MDWIEVTISTNTEGADIVSEALMRQGAVGTQIIDRSDVPDPDKPNGYWELIDRKMLDEMPEDVQVKAWFSTVEELRGLKNCLDALPELTGMDLGTLQISQAGVHEQDWAECWKQYYKPFRAGEHLVIKPSWEAWDEQPGDLVIELDPGMAFGTGTHETTAMCVAMIEKHYHGGEVLDVGTGSGILAIGAALLGAKDVLAIDIDPTAVKVARENVAHNHLEQTVTTLEGNLLEKVDAQCEVCVANIIADVICMFAAPLNDHIVPGGLFICSGIIKEREQDVTGALLAAGYTILDIRRKGEWVAMISRRHD